MKTLFAMLLTTVSLMSLSAHADLPNMSDEEIFDRASAGNLGHCRLHVDRLVYTIWGEPTAINLLLRDELYARYDMYRFETATARGPKKVLESIKPKLALNIKAMVDSGLCGDID